MSHEWGLINAFLYITSMKKESFKEVQHNSESMYMANWVRLLAKGKGLMIQAKRVRILAKRVKILSKRMRILAKWVRILAMG